MLLVGVKMASVGSIGHLWGPRWRLWGQYGVCGVLMVLDGAKMASVGVKMVLAGAKMASFGVNRASLGAKMASVGSQDGVLWGQ